jgi:uncharacterized small protein (DUF1192 family)
LIKQVSRNKKRKKIGEDLSLGSVNLEEKRGIAGSIEEIEKLGAEAKKQADMKNFFEVQLPLLKSTQEETTSV